MIALDRLVLTVPPAAVELLGADGAGMTTLLRLLLGNGGAGAGVRSVAGATIYDRG
ncbi:MAG: hypothetical protein M3Q03_19555 [Chloroflexota bacterium]|nr:hypothetical protein [Chloroflexota bacterium]